MPITLPADARQKLIGSIKRYFAESLDQDVGDLKASLLLDYCLAEIGPSVYNQAVTDARAYLQDRLGDLEGACYEKELTYWAVASSPFRKQKPPA